MVGEAVDLGQRDPVARATSDTPGRQPRQLGAFRTPFCGVHDAELGSAPVVSLPCGSIPQGGDKAVAMTERRYPRVITMPEVADRPKARGLRVLPERVARGHEAQRQHGHRDTVAPGDEAAAVARRL